MIKPIVLNGVEINAGETKNVRMKVARLHSGTRINLDLNIYRSKNPGPTMLVLGGVHGDEINGVEIVRRTISTGMFDSLKCGSAIVIPLLNIYGFINFSREVPDGKDVNRSFPGSKTGSLASRVAWILFKEVLPFVDFGVDFHTGGASRYNYPQVRYTKGDSGCRKLARAFAAPVTMCNRPIAKSLRNEAHKINKPFIVFEGGEALRFDSFSLDHGLLGLRRVMKANDMIDDDIPAQHLPQYEFQVAKWLRASRSGIFVWARSSGEFVTKGELLGMIYEPHGKDQVKVKATRNGFIIGHNNAPVVHQGDALFHIAYAEKPIVGSDKGEMEPEGTD